MKILFKYPTRGRPVWFIKTLDLFSRMLSGKHECEFLIAMDNDDQTMQNELMLDYLFQIEPPVDSMTKLSWYYKDHKNKVEAINSCIAAHEFDIVVPISDDVEPQEVGYDDIIAQSMIESFPDLEGVIYFNDGRTHKRVVSIPIFGRKMFDQIGHITHPRFAAWGDKFTTHRLKQTGKVRYYERILLRHCWAKYGRYDATYRRAMSAKSSDLAIYREMETARVKGE